MLFVNRVVELIRKTVHRAFVHDELVFDLGLVEFCFQRLDIPRWNKLVGAAMVD